MSRKTRADKRSSAKKSVIQNSANSILSRFSSIVSRFDPRTKIISCVLLASLIAGVTYAGWMRSNVPETQAKQSQTGSQGLFP